jgi:hypothetical protein
MLEAEEIEWIVYRLKSGGLSAVSRARWNRWLVHAPAAIKNMVDGVVAQGLTREQAERFMALTKEN